MTGRASGTRSHLTPSARVFLLVGLGLGVVLSLLEATEGTSGSILPMGPDTDHVVDALLLIVIVVSLGRGLVPVARGVVLAAAGGDPVVSAHSDAIVRLGGDDTVAQWEALRTLELVGQAAPEQRRAVVSAWCSYLRGPLMIGRAEPRALAQALLATHLRPADAEEVLPAYWPEVREVDLAGAYLVDLDLRRCHLPSTSFQGSVLVGCTSFEAASFDDESWFADTTFAGTVSFADTTFRRGAGFYGAVFEGGASFESAHFEGDASFEASTFSGVASFRRAAFARGTDVGDASFPAGVSFDGARIGSRSRSRVRLPPGWTWTEVSDPGWAAVVPVLEDE